MKVKYTINRQWDEINDRYKRTIRASCLWDTDYGRTNFDYETVEVFDSKEEALAALKNYKAEVRRFSDHNVRYWSVTEYFVEEVEFDDDEEEINFEFLDWAEMEFSVIEKSECKVLATFDNFGDALDYYDDMLHDQQDYDEDDEDYDEKDYYIECNDHWVYGNI